MNTEIKIEEIQAIWHMLPKNYRVIFMLIDQELDYDRFPSAIPTIERLAKWSGFEKDTVLEALNRMDELKWLTKITVHDQHNIYRIIKDLKIFKFNISKVSYKP